MLGSPPPSEHWWNTEPKVNACTPNLDAKTSSEEASQRLGLQEARHYDASEHCLEHKAKGQCFDQYDCRLLGSGAKGQGLQDG